MISRRARLFLALASGLLLLFSFPDVSQGWLAWIALAPLGIAVSKSPSRGEATWLAWCCGFFFLFLSLSGLRFVTVFGWIFLAALHALIFSMFGFFSREWSRARFPLYRPLAGAIVWTVMEVVRAEIPVFAMGANLLGYSQAFYPALIQTAGLFGVFGVSFLMCFVNLLVADAARRSFRIFRPAAQKRPFWQRSASALFYLAVALTVVGANALFGLLQLSQPLNPVPTARIALIQGNIPQSLKWETMARDQIWAIHEKLTRLAEFHAPDLVIWPEASFPGFFNSDPLSENVKDLASSLDRPMIVGAPYLESPEKAYNSAFYIDGDGEIAGRYDKMRLVPFGEYLPLQPLLGWLKPLASALGVSDFSAGDHQTIFELPRSGVKFGVLICFEDTFPSLARHFADKGVRFLAVITNDAWFGPTAMPYQHLQASIFRAVESGVSVVRAANTGVSAFIDDRGRVLDRVRGPDGRDIFSAGQEVLPMPLNPHRTFFRQGGWLFPYAALLLFVIIVPPSFGKKKRLSREGGEN